MDYLINRIFKTLKSVKLGMYILGFILLFTLMGAYIPQSGTLPEEQILTRYGANLFNCFKSIGLFHIFSTWWFITLELLFAINLTLVTFYWSHPVIQYVKTIQWKNTQQVLALPFHHTQQFITQESKNNTLKNLLTILQKSGYKVHHHQDCFYATKNAWTRFAAIYVHVGLLLIVLSAIIAVFFSFKSFAMIPVQGAAFVKSLDLEHHKIFLGKIPDWQIKVNNFRIETYPNEMEKQFYSDLSLVDTNQQELLRKVIYVNAPLQYDGITIYQTSYAPTGNIWITINNKSHKILMNKKIQDKQAGLWEDQQIGKVLLLNTATKENKTIVIVWQDHQTGKPQLRSLKQGQSIRINKGMIHFDQLEYMTGLSIKSAPEVPLFYFAGTLVVFGIFVAWLSHKEIWISTDTNNEITLGGLCNKAKVSFAHEFESLIDQGLNGTEIKHSF